MQAEGLLGVAPAGMVVDAQAAALLPRSVAARGMLLAVSVPFHLYGQERQLAARAYCIVVIMALVIGRSSKWLIWRADAWQQVMQLLRWMWTGPRKEGKPRRVRPRGAPLLLFLLSIDDVGAASEYVSNDRELSLFGRAAMPVVERERE